MEAKCAGRSATVVCGVAVGLALLMVAPGLSWVRSSPAVSAPARLDEHSAPALRPTLVPPLPPGMPLGRDPSGQAEPQLSYPPGGQVYVGPGPFAAAYDPVRGEVFVTDFGSDNVSVISDSTDTVVKIISVGYGPAGIAYDSHTGEMFVADFDYDNVSVISDATDAVVATIPVGSIPVGVAYDPSEGEVFVANEFSDNVSVISDASDRVVATVHVGDDPYALTFDPVQDCVYVVNAESSNVSVISAETDTIVATVAVGYLPIGIAFVAPVGEAFVTDGAAGNVTVIETEGNTVVGTIPVGVSPFGIAYEDEFGNLYVTNQADENITVIQASSGTVIGSIALGVIPGYLTYDNSTEQFFVADSSGDNVTIVNDTAASVEVQLWKGTWFGSGACSNGSTVPPETAPPQDTMFWLGVASPGVNWFPFGPAWFTAAFSATLYVPRSGVYGFALASDDGSTAFLDGHLLVSTPGGYCKGAGSGTSFVGLSAGAHQLRVYHYENGIGASSVNLSWEPPGTSDFAQIPAGAFAYPGGLPISVGASPGTPIYADGQIFVPDAGSASLTVISGATDEVVANLTVGLDPGTPVYDPATQQVFVPNFGSDDVSVISAANDYLVWTDNAGAGPETGAYDPVTGEIYVPNANSGNVTVISGWTDTVVANVNVGADPQTPAFDGANGDLYVANNGSDNVSVINATFGVVVATVPVGSEPGTPAVDPANGEIYVPDWGSDDVFVISGLTNTVVVVIVVGSSPFVPHGSASPFIFSRTTKPRGSPLFDAQTQEVYVPNENSGNVTVINASRNTVVANVAVGSGPQAPVLDPANGNVYVANNGSANISVISASTSQVVASIPTGSDPTSPVFDNASQSLYVPNTGAANLTVVRGSYYLSFTETGLPNGSDWEVALTGAGGSSTQIFSRTTVPTEPLGNGTVRYTVFGPKGYQVGAGSVPTAAVAIAGSDVVETIHFVPGPTRSVTFQESGLPKGVSWCASLGAVACTNTSKLTFENVTPYQYPYSVAPTPVFSLTITKGGSRYEAPPGSVVNVTTRDVTVKLKFKEVTYGLTFSETGLAPHTGWTVKISWTVGGKLEQASKHTTKPTLTFQVPNGTVTCTVEPVKGYSGPSSGTVTIDGAPLTIPVSFSKA